MHWNHRVIRFNTKDEGEKLMIAEVYYDEKNKPMSYGEPFMLGDNMGELKELVARLDKCLTQPIIDATEFPNQGEE